MKTGADDYLSNKKVYSINNLTTKDREKVELAEQLKLVCLNEKTIEDFLDTKEINGSTVQNIYRETLSDFLEYLKEQIEYFKVDLIISAVENDNKKNIGKERANG